MIFMVVWQGSTAKSSIVPSALSRVQPAPIDVDLLDQIVIEASDALSATADPTDVYLDATDRFVDAATEQAFDAATVASVQVFSGAAVKEDKQQELVTSPAGSNASTASAASAADTVCTEATTPSRTAADLIVAAAVDIRLRTLEIQVVDMQQSLIAMQQYTKISQRKRLSEGCEIMKLDKITLDQKYLRDEIDRALRRFQQSEHKFNEDVSNMGMELRKLRDNFLCLFEMTHNASLASSEQQIEKKSTKQTLTTKTDAKTDAKAEPPSASAAKIESPSKSADTPKKRASLIDLFTRSSV